MPANASNNANATSADTELEGMGWLVTGTGAAGAGPMNKPAAEGAPGNAIVAVTVLVTASITETLFDK